MRILLIMAAFLSFLGRLLGAEEKPGPKIAPIYQSMRELCLKMDPKAAGADPEKPVVALLMEMGFPNGSATLMVAADSSTSMYFSGGGGIIGAGKHAEVKAAGQEMLSTATEFLPQFKKTESFPVPASGMITFYLVTRDGVLTYSAKEVDLGEKRDKLSKLFHAGQAVITQVRLVDEKSKQKP